MTNQDVFDRVYTHLVKQGCRSRSDYTGDCLYRGPGGVSCAVGCLIPDEIYEPSMEGLSVASLVRNKNIAALFEGVDLGFLQWLQSFHDSGSSWNEAGLTEMAHQEMKDLAQRWGLHYVRPRV